MKPIFNTHSLFMLGLGVLVYSILTANTESADSAADHHNHDRDEGRYSFALWGDLPYAKNGDDAKIARLTNSMSAANLDFIVFDGGIKMATPFAQEISGSNLVF